MLSPSLALALLVVLTGLIAIAVLVWAFLRGWIDEDAITQQSTSILDADDLRATRPWESEDQRRERVALHGDPVEPTPGAFGGAQ